MIDPRRVPAIAALVALVLHGSDARADIKDAEELFRQGKAEMEKGNHARACAMFAESHRQDPAMGTLLNLALCHEAIGRIATAWGEWRAVEQQARAAVPPRSDRATLAREHAEKLEPRVSRLSLVVEGQRPDGFAIEIDGEEKGEPLWAGVPVDPGTHEVRARAPGKKTLTMPVKVDDEGVVVSITVPALEDAPAPTPSTQEPAAAVKGAELEQVEAFAANRARRTTGFVVAGIGLATLAAGGAFGVAAIVNDGAAADACPGRCIAGTAEADEADRATDRALTFANIANVTIPLGVLGAAIGAYLVLSAGPTQKVALTPVVSPRASGLSLRAEW